MTWEAECITDSALFLWTPEGFTADALTDESGNSRAFDQRSWGDVPYAAWMDVATAFTLEAWFNTTNTGLNAIAARDGASNRVFQCRTNTGSFEFVKIAGGTVTVSKAASVNDGNDHHGFVTYDGATISVYVDNGTAATGAGTGNLNGASRNLTIGCRYSANTVSPADLFLGGSIKGVAYYGSVLNSTRRAAHYNAGAPAGSWSGSGTWGLVS